MMNDQQQAAALQPFDPMAPVDSAGQPNFAGLYHQITNPTTPGIDVTPMAGGIGGEIRNIAGGAIRGLAGLLQPLQLPQDVMFAAIAGAEDPNSTIMQRLSKVEWAKYAPFGAAPARPATGEEIFQLMGLHGAAAKWAGIGADLIVDPLIFGSYLRVAGKLGKIEELVKLGDKFDTAISPLGIGRELSKPVAAAVRKSDHLSAFVDSRMNAMLSVLRNPDAEMFGIPRFGQKATNLLGKVMPRDAFLRMRFGADTGQALFMAESMSGAAGRRLSTSALEQLAQAQHGAFGLDGQQFVKKYTDALGSVRAAFEANLGDMPTILRDTMESQVYHAADKTGFMHLFNEPSQITDPTVQGLFNDAMNATKAERASMAWQKKASDAQDAIAGAHQRVLQALEASGLDMKPAEVIRRFDDYLKNVVQIDARLGYETSGLGFVRDTMRSRVFGLTGSEQHAQDFWSGLLGAGIVGDFSKYLDSASPFRPSDLAKPTKEAVQQNAARRTAYMQQIQDEMTKAGITGGGIDAVKFNAAADQLGKQIEGLQAQLEKVKAFQRYETQPLWEDLQNKLASYKGVAAETMNLGKRMARQGVRASEFERGQAREVLDKAFAAKQRAEQTVEDSINALRDHLQKNMAERAAPVSDMQQAYQQLDQMGRDFNSQRFARSTVNLSPEEVQAARKRAAQSAQAKGAAAPVPSVHGKNATADDMIATRLLRGMGYDEAVSKPFTYREILDGTANMGALDVGAYLKNLSNGHLRRAFGIFMDERGFTRYTDAMRKGKIVSNNVLDELNLGDYISNPKAVSAINQYRTAIAAKGSGVVLRQDAMLKHMVESGLTPADAKTATKELITNLHANSPEFKQYLSDLETLRPDYVSLVDSYRQGSRTALAASRKDIPQKMLDMLGEYANASISIFESAENARRVIGPQQYMQQVYKMAKDRGLVSTAPKVDEFGAAYKQFGIGGQLAGPFDGLYIHPHLQTEINRALTPGKNLYGPLQRIRSLLMGGFLASPSVLSANFFGNLYQVALLGIHPVDITKALMSSAGDVSRAAAGKDSELVSTLKSLIPLELTGMEYQDLRHAFERVRWADMGMGPDGISKAFDQVTTAYERFLRRPGFGPVRMKYAGLEGFQYIENWFKVASFKHMRETLTKALPEAQRTPEALASIDRRAAEFARVSVFDYSTLPESLRTLRNTGLLMFPGFPYFMAGRTMSALAKNPGGLAVADRMSEAVANMALSQQDQYTLYMGMPDWMKQDQGVPIVVRKGRDGNRQVAVIPLGQMLPTTTLWDGPFGSSNPWAQSLAEGGIWGPLAEALIAIAGFSPQRGQAIMSQRYGNRVFDPEAHGIQEASQVFRFLYNTMAPSIVKKLIQPDYNGGWRGLFPDAYHVLVPHDTANQLYSFNEVKSRTPDKNLKDSVLAAFLRSPTEVAMSGPLAGIRKQLTVQRAQLNTELTSIRKKMQRAAYDGDQKAVEHYQQEYQKRVDDFASVWVPYMDYYQRTLNQSQTGQ